MYLNQILTKLNSSSGEKTHRTSDGFNKLYSLDFGSSGAADSFWNEYLKSVSKKNSMTLSERIPEYAPTMIDFSLDFEKCQDNLRSGDSEGFEEIVHLCQDVILDQVIFDDDEIINCVLLRKSLSETSMIYRLHFLNCKMSKANIFSLVEKVKSKLRLKNGKSLFDTEPIGSWDEIVSTPISGTYIPLHGSSRDGKPPFVLEDIYNGSDGDSVLEDVCKLGDHVHITTGLLQEDFVDDNESDLYYLPLVLSMGFKNEISVASFESFEESELSNSDKSFAQRGTDELISMISPEKFEQKHYWLEIGKALHKIYDGDDDGLTRWKELAADKNFLVKIGEVYESFDTNMRVTEKTLHFYAREDSPEIYAAAAEERNFELFLESISGTMTTGDSAALFNEIYGLEFVSDGQSLYYFDGIVWQESGHIDFFKHFSAKDGKFIKCVDNWIQKLAKLSSIGGVGGKSRRESERIRVESEMNSKRAHKYRDTVKKFGFKNVLLKEFINLISARGLVFDTATNLTGVRNGILEATETEIIFRKSKPEDYVKNCCSARWDTKMDSSHRNTKLLLMWLKQVFPDKGSRDYFERFCGYLLIAGNGENIFPFWTGGGGNSKGTVKKLFEETFGVYSVDIPVKYLLNDGRGGGPNPELAQCAGSRIVFLQEPKGGEMDESTFKTLSGDDTYFARKCNKDGGSIVSTFVPVLICNEIPTMNVREAERRRLAILSFISKWVDDPPESTAERYRRGIFLKDPLFKRIIPKLTSALLWYCARGYKKYKEFGLSPPKSVEVANKIYVEDSNYVLDFFTQKLIRAVTINEDGTLTEHAHCKISCDELIKSYGEWLKISNPHKKIETMKTFKKLVTEIVGHKPVNGCWSGYKYSAVSY